MTGLNAAWNDGDWVDLRIVTYQGDSFKSEPVTVETAKQIREVFKNKDGWISFPNGLVEGETLVLRNKDIQMLRFTKVKD